MPTMILSCTGGGEPPASVSCTGGGGSDVLSLIPMPRLGTLKCAVIFCYGKAAGSGGANA